MKHLSLLNFPEIERRELRIGFAEEIAIAEEEEFDAAAKFVLAQIEQRKGGAALDGFYVSHVDLFTPDR